MMMTRIHSLLVATITFQILLIDSSAAWMSSASVVAKRSVVRPTTIRRYNVLGDWLSGGALQTQSSLPYDPPLCTETISFTNSNTEQRTFAIQERALSWTGEDFDVQEISPSAQSTSYCQVRGALLHLPGKDKLRLYQQKDLMVAELDRKLVALTPTYDIYRGSSDRTKLGWIERKMIALTDTFELHLEGVGFGPLKPPAAFYLEGDFLDRRFVMKNNQGKVVAKVTKEGKV
jgi:uncharacterized protein YxjI